MSSRIYVRESKWVDRCSDSGDSIVTVILVHASPSGDSSQDLVIYTSDDNEVYSARRYACDNNWSTCDTWAVGEGYVAKTTHEDYSRVGICIFTCVHVYRDGYAELVHNTYSVTGRSESLSVSPQDRESFKKYDTTSAPE